jgi:CRISPR-associated protein (TIGR03986 family)
VPAGLKEIEGYVCNTGQNIDRKHDEKIFFKDASNPLPINDVTLTQSLRDLWGGLIKNYRHEHDDGSGALKDPPSAIWRDPYTRQKEELDLEWSRHIQRTSANETGLEAELEAEKLEDGTLCYARVRQIKGGDFEVLELIPVIISRRIHKYAPTEFLDDALQPAQDLRELSPADRVFGWARQSKSKFRIKELSKEERGQSAYRGQIRISTVECTHAVVTRLDEDEKELGLSLSILGQPKPQQGRFYVAEDKHGNAQEANGINNEEAGYDRSGKGLRGRKVYPHHANLPSDYWQKPTDPNLETSGKDQGFFKEYRRPQKASGEEQRDNQNRSVQAWVEKGTTFEFDVHFTNLSDVELGALLWLLKLGKDHFFRLGGGKPLGFGSVSLELLGCDVRDGAAWREYYGSLDAHEEPDHNAGEHFAVKDASNQHKANSEQIVKAYQDAALASYKEVVLKAYRNGEESFEKISFIAAFLQAARGFVNEAGKCLPTHYPRARHETGSHLVPPHVDGLAYEWFVENAKKPRDNPETQIVLSDLVDQEGKPDRGLPILFHEPKGRG